MYSTDAIVYCVSSLADAGPRVGLELAADVVSKCLDLLTRISTTMRN